MDEQARYGVFLRPDARTCAAITTVTTLLRAQYGLISAGAFPPHATLAGSLALRTGPDQLLVALSTALAQTRALVIENAGVRRLGEATIAYDIHDLDGAANTSLVELAAVVDDVLRPLLAEATGLQPDTYDPARWHGHLSLASHDLIERPDLREEVERYIHELDVEHPARFTADTVALYRLWHPSWTGRWWRAMRWEHVESLHLAG